MPDGLPPLLPPSPAQLAELTTFYQTGRHLDAYVLCQSLAPLASWRGPEALVLAGRLANRWGDDVLSRQLQERAYREHPSDPLAIYYHAYNRWLRHGPFEALQFTRQQTRELPLVPQIPAQAYLWLLHARLLGSFRDFSAAEPIVQRIVESFGHDPWVRVDQAEFLESQDCYEEAEQAATEALRLQPTYTPAIVAKAHLLQLQQKDAEAGELLRAALERTQAGVLVKMLVSLLEEEGRLDEIPPLLDLVARYLPTPDEADRRWLAGRRCMNAYRSGHHALALEQARAAGTRSPYFAKIAERLAANPTGTRVHLRVGFIRQHHMTCAPATLAALSNFWGIPADHLEIARRICYDGTPGHLEREWAEAAGWHVREFRMTWDAARALLDRGCPFSVVTVDPENAHMQAVIGYDSILETLLVRDPYQRQFREWRAPEFFEVYAAHGPRAMLLLPTAEAGRVADVELPDAALYDQVHRLRLALEKHDRPAAESAVAELQRLDPANLLTHWSTYDLAMYDGRLFPALAAIKAIREAFPKNDTWRLNELRLRERLGNPMEHRQLLKELGERRSAYGVFRREYGEELTRDARTQPQAERLLRSLLRRQALDAKTLRAYANLLWNRQDFQQATEIYRFAACRAEKTEYHWDSYFIASRYLNQTDTAVALLQNRVERWGASSSHPARTLFDSLNALDRTPEAFEVLTRARSLRPDDGELLLFSAEALTRYGRNAEAAELLSAARSREGRHAWLRSASRIADYQRDHRQSLEYWRELAALNPADTSAYSAISRLLRITEGTAAATAYLQQACREQPCLTALHQSLVTLLRDHPAEQALEAVERLLALDPADAWAWREKAQILRRLGRREEALASADRAVLIAPNSPSSHGIRATMLQALGRQAEAHAGYTTGIRLSIDAHSFFEWLIDTCPDFDSRGVAVKFIHAELMREPSMDGAVLQFRAVARSIVSTAELTTMLRAYLAAWPKDWSSYSALASHCLDTGEIDEALALTTQATGLFPLVPRAWLDLAAAQARKGDGAGQIASIEKALAINSGWSHASRLLSAAHERQLRLDLAEHVLRRAVAADPTDPANHNWLADILWRRRQTADALATLEISLSLDPNNAWAWDRLQEWSRETDRPQRAQQMAQQLTEARAGEAGPWLQLVRLRFSDENPAANLAALDRAATLAPDDTDGWDLRAQLLAQHRRYDEALASCRPPSLGDPPPWNLQGRAAWIEEARGAHDKAIELMAAVVEKHPDYRWGWGRLTEWHWNKKQCADTKRCAERWSWLEPANSVPHGFLALVHLEEKRRPVAKAALTRAIELDPLYYFGSTELLKLCLEDSDFDGARRVLKHYETHYHPAEALRAEIRLHLATKDRAAATTALRKIALLPGKTPADTLRHTVAQLLEAGWTDVVEQALANLLTDPAAQIEVGEHWVAARRKNERPWTTFWRLLRLKPAPHQRSTLYAGYVTWLGEDKKIKRLWLARTIWRKSLRAEISSWGQTGYALISAERHRACARWLSDWAARPEAPKGWMMHNLVLALQELHRVDQAKAVLDAALRLPADHAYDKLLVSRACEHALDGEVDSAARLMSQVNQTDLTRYYQSLCAIARVLVTALNAEPEQKVTAAKNGLAELETEKAGNPALNSDRVLRRSYRRAVDLLARLAKQPWTRIRNRLPKLGDSPATHSSSRKSDTDIPPWLIWMAVVFAMSAMRACSGMH